MDKWLTYANSKIFYNVSGQGEPVMLIHGFAEDGNVWRYQKSFLESKYQIIVPDVPGSGKSALLSGDNDEVGMEHYAECMNAILEAEKITVCTVIGHSMGGYIALAFAEKFPEKLKGLGLFHSSAYADSEEKKQIRLKGIDFINRLGSREFLKQSIPNLFGQNFRQKNPQMIETLIDSGANFSSRALVQYYAAMLGRPDRTGVLKNCNKPILFIIGDEDKSVNLQDSLTQCHIPVLSQILVLSGVAHMGMWEATDESNTAIMKYLTLLNVT